VLTSIKAWVIAISAASLITTFALLYAAASIYKGRAEVLQDKHDELLRKHQTAQVAISACMEVNLENSLQRDKENQRAKAAEARIAQAEQDANIEIEEMRSEIARLRGRDLACPALDNTFRNWMFTDPAH
jgi:hypothetical protein